MLLDILRKRRYCFSYTFETNVKYIHLMPTALTCSLLQLLTGLLVVSSATIYGVLYLEREIGALRSFWKTLPVGIMAASGMIVGGPVLLPIALLLCAIGDYFLSRDDDRFVAGLSAFLAGHIVYIILFASLTNEFEPHWLMLGIILFSGIFARYLWGVTGKYRWPVLAYIVVITAMAGVSLTLPPASSLAILGAFIFVLSDSVLAMRMFVLTNSRTKRAFSRVVWITYILGQTLIFIGVIGVPL